MGACLLLGCVERVLLYIMLLSELHALEVDPKPVAGGADQSPESRPGRPLQPQYPDTSVFQLFNSQRMGQSISRLRAIREGLVGLVKMDRERIERLFMHTINAYKHQATPP